MTDKPLLGRKEMLSKNVKEGFNLSISRYVSTKGVAFFELAKKENLEGIVAKKKDGLYYIGKRTSEWIKIKVMQDEDYAWKEQRNSRSNSTGSRDVYSDLFHLLSGDKVLLL